MSPQRWLFVILTAILGIGLGLYFGWVISPVKYVDTTPAMMRVDFRADYTLMVAESFQSDQDLEKAARKLAILGSQPPVEFVDQALNFGKQNNYSPADINLLQSLGVALQVWQPGATPQQAPPLPTIQQP